MSKQEDFHRPEKMREIDNKARISKEAKMKRKFNRNQKLHNSVRHPAKLSNILAITTTLFWVSMHLGLLNTILLVTSINLSCWVLGSSGLLGFF